MRAKNTTVAEFCSKGIILKLWDGNTAKERLMQCHGKILGKRRVKHSFSAIILTIFYSETEPVKLWTPFPPVMQTSLRAGTKLLFVVHSSSPSVLCDEGIAVL